MKNIRWLLTLADGKPLLFSLAILMIATSVLSAVVINRDIKIGNCENEKNIIRNNYERKIDSVINIYQHREMALTLKVETTLNSIIEDYKNQLKEQKELNGQISSTINKTKSIIKSNRTKLKKL